MTKIAINGFGRIGRHALKVILASAVLFLIIFFLVTIINPQEKVSAPTLIQTLEPEAELETGKVETSTDEKEDLGSDLEIKNKILKLYEENKSNENIYNLLIDGYSINKEYYDPGYDFDILDRPVTAQFSVLKDEQVVGTFEGDSGCIYYPVYVKQNEIFMATSCSGIGGMYFGELEKFNIMRKEKISIISGVWNLFVTSDQKYLAYFTINDDRLSYNLFMFDFETGRAINQFLKLTPNPDIWLGVINNDLFFENNSEILYVPINYSDIEIGTSYKLTKSNDVKIEKFSKEEFDEVILNYISPKDETVDWKTYRNEEYGFEVKYPSILIGKDFYRAGIYNEAWTLVESYDKNIIFGTQSSKAGGGVWGIFIKDDLESCGGRGTQFADRKEAIKEIKIGELNAKLITVTTNSNPDWISEIICIAKNNMVFEIGNGAVKIPEFKIFYNTFKFIGKDEIDDEEIVEVETLMSKDDFDYEIETFEGYDDQRIIKIDKNDKKEILIHSIKDSVLELKINGRILSGFAASEKHNLIFFRSAWPDGGASCNSLYSYDISSNKFKKLEVNEKVEAPNGRYGFCGFDGFALSLDQTKLIWIPQATDDGDDKIMYLIDLLEDNYMLLVELKNNETFNGGLGALLASQFVEWIDDNKIRYAVYDQSKKSSEDYSLNYHSQESINNILIEYRELAVNKF